MELLAVERERFRLGDFLDALHRFSIASGGEGDPLPVVIGSGVYYDPVDLVEALANEGDESVEIPDDSLSRLEAGLTIFGQFTSFDGYDRFVCANGSRLPLREDADECHAFGVTIALFGESLEIEGTELYDSDGECELTALSEPTRISRPMRRWVRSFVNKPGNKKCPRTH